MEGNIIMMIKFHRGGIIILLLISSLIFSGCVLSLIPLPEIKVTLKLFSANIPESSFEQWVNKEITIGKVCTSSGFDIESLRQRAIEEIQKLPLSSWMTRILTYAVNEIDLKSVMVDKITLKATTGDFSKITKLSAKIRINNSDLIDLGEGKFNETKTEIYFDKSFNVLDYLNKNTSEQTCVEGSLIVTGTLGTQTINFDGIFDLSIKISF